VEDAEYLRYKLTASGVSALAAPGDANQRFTADGLEHNEKGTPSAKHSDHQQQLQKRQQKLEHFVYGDDWAEVSGEGDIALVCFGSSAAAVAEAAEMLEEQGLSTRSVALRLLAPLQVDALATALQGAGQLVVVEQNHSAQLYHYLRGQMDFPQQLHSYAMAGPVPLNAQQIADYVLEVSA
jgi:2-oxoglutarate ferredoxin oxidoreductase subunit alpha